MNIIKVETVELSEFIVNTNLFKLLVSEDDYVEVHKKYILKKVTLSFTH